MRGHDLSYAEYLSKAGQKDSRQAWIDWKIVCCGMEPKEAAKVADDPDWGWTPDMMQNVEEFKREQGL